VVEANPSATVVDVAATSPPTGVAFLFCPLADCTAPARDAQGAGIPVVTAYGAEIGRAPDTALAATPLALTSLYRDAFHLVRAQRWGQVTFTSTIENGQVDVVVHGGVRHDLLAAPADELASTAAELVSGLRAGTVKLPAAT